MAKTRADIQKAHRERKKAKEGSAYLNNEVKRVEKYYHRTVHRISPKLNRKRDEKRSGKVSTNTEDQGEEGQMKNLPLRIADWWVKWTLTKEEKRHPLQDVLGRKLRHLKSA